MTHLKRPWYSERLRMRGEVDDRGWDGWMVSPTQLTWIWVSSGSCWWTGRPGVLHSMGLLRVRHDWATELTDNIHKFHLQNVVFLLLYTLQHSHHQKFVSVNHHTVDSLYPFHFSHCHPSPVITPTLFSVSTCLFLFGLVCSFILLLFFVLHVCVKSNSICLYLCFLIQPAWWIREIIPIIWRREWQTNSVFLAWEHHEQYEKAILHILQMRSLKWVKLSGYV